MAEKTIQQAIEEAAIDGIQSSSIDGMSATAMSIDDQIKAAKYLAGQQAAGQPHQGLRFIKLVPPGGGGR